VVGAPLSGGDGLPAAGREGVRDRTVRDRRLTFEDLLLGAARLLRTHVGARRALGERYRHLLVDEFQDTDPIQAEVCLLLASDPADGVDWRAVTPRPGALFVVGDPKQSIYRFRRADIQTYEQVKQRFAGFGAVLRLTQNFRSVAPIGELVTTYFDGPFKPESSVEQAAFAPLITVHEAAGHDGVRWCGVTPDQNYPNRIIAADAKQLAAWIATRIDAEERDAEDFLCSHGDGRRSSTTRVPSRSRVCR
jgi:ATP-dependent helicase/nuclease subunit A